MTPRTPEEEIARLKTALEIARLELKRLTRVNMAMAAEIHRCRGLDGEPMARSSPHRRPRNGADQG